MRIFYFVCILAGFLLSLESQLRSEVTDKSIDRNMDRVRNLAIQVNSEDTTPLKFNVGSSRLSLTDSAAIQVLVRDIRAQSRIEKVFVAVWSDRPYPSETSANLKASDVGLAERRAMRIANALHTMEVDHVEIFNMAKEPNWLQTLLNTNKAELDAVMTGQKVGDRNLAQLGQILQRSGGPSKAVVMVQRSALLSH